MSDRDPDSASKPDNDPSAPNNPFSLARVGNEVREAVQSMNATFRDATKLLRNPLGRSLFAPGLATPPPAGTSPKSHADRQRTVLPAEASGHRRAEDIRTEIIERRERARQAVERSAREREGLENYRSAMRGEPLEADLDPAAVRRGVQLIDALRKYCTVNWNAHVEACSPLAQQTGSVPARSLVRVAWEELVSKLRSGELVATGFFGGTSPEPLPAEAWEIVEMRSMSDLGASVVFINDIRVAGVRVRGRARADQSDPIAKPKMGETARPPYRSGVRGRPPMTSKELVLQEVNRRGREQLLELSLAAQVRLMNDWMRANHSEWPGIAPSTMEKLIRADYHRWRSAPRTNKPKTRRK